MTDEVQLGYGSRVRGALHAIKPVAHFGKNHKRENGYGKIVD